MMHKMLIAVLASLAMTAGAVAEEWHNYASGYDPAIRLSSERDTQIGTGEETATWTIEDFHFPTEGGGPENGGQYYDIEQIEWVGVREHRTRTGFGYDFIDWAIFEGDPGTFTAPQTPVHSGTASQTPGPGELGWVMNDLADSLPAPLRAYRGTLDLSSINVALTPGTTYWVGVRLVGNPANAEGGSAGRNYIASSVAGHVESIGEGWNYDPAFAGSEWVPASDRFPLSSEEREFAYKVNAVWVPEPGSIALLAVGAMLFGRRKFGRASAMVR